MQLRWHRWWLLAVLVPGCFLNPQPDVPSASSGPPFLGAGASSTSSGGSNSGDSPGQAGGGTAINVPPSGGAAGDADGSAGAADEPGGSAGVGGGSAGVGGA